MSKSKRDGVVTITMSLASQFQNLPIDRLHESSTNPRRSFDPAKLQELAESIRTQGLVQPIVARPNAEGFEIVAGARRFRASQLAELSEVPVRVVALTDEQALEWQLIENSQREDVHPYEEAQGYTRLLDLPGYDVPTVALKTGKSESHVYARLKLLNLIDEVSTAFVQDRITSKHAILIARLPAERQTEAFKQCWRKDWQDNEPHLLPAKYLGDWLQSNLYLNLADAPFDTDDATLIAEVGRCAECAKRSGFNTRLFDDVLDDVCLDSSCWNAKLSASLSRALEQRPELVQIATGWIPAKERRPEVLLPSDYQRLNTENEERTDDPTLCPSAQDALIVEGESIGSIIPVCIDAECPVHGRKSPERTEQQEAEEREWQRQQQKRERIYKQRTGLLERIVDAAPDSFSAEHLRFILRALVTSELYSVCSDLATHYYSQSADDDRRGEEEALLEILNTAGDKQLIAFAIRLALMDHLSEPRKGQVDYLKQAASLFVPTPTIANRKKQQPSKAHIQKGGKRGKHQGKRSAR